VFDLTSQITHLELLVSHVEDARESCEGAGFFAVEWFPNDRAIDRVKIILTFDISIFSSCFYL